MSDQAVVFATHSRKLSFTVRFLRRMALGILGIVILVWFVDREELINSYRGIETTRATGLSAVTSPPPPHQTSMLMMNVTPKLRLEQAAIVERGRQIARTATLQISVRDFSAARDSMDRIVNARGGVVISLNISYPRDSSKSLSAQLAIPSAQRDAAMEDFRRLGRVETEVEGSEEVTAQAEDLAIRLKNSREEEARLASILRMGTGKVSDVLEVEREQTRVREEIESMEAQQRRLSSRVSFASIDLNLTEDYQAPLGLHGPLSGLRIRNAFAEGLHDAAEGFADVIMSLLSAGPSLLLWGLIFFWPARWAWRRWRTSRMQATAGD
jgi:Domain of unknown function (DUF4349)